MRNTKIKQFILLFGLLLTTAWCSANMTLSFSFDGLGHIVIKENVLQGTPKGSTIQAYINGHVLTVVFTENLGQVEVEVATASGVSVQYTSTPTPNGLQIFIPNTGNYIITFTLSNGDEYYGEFTVSD